MTLSTTFFDKIKYKSTDFINRDKDIYGAGVVNLTDFPISYPSTPNMTVNVGQGTAWVDGYRIANDTNLVNLSIVVADPTNPRVDIIQVGYSASTDANGDTTGNPILEIKQGVAASSPIEPGADPGFVKLYTINIAANQTTVTSADVIDRRQLVPLNIDIRQIKYTGDIQTAQLTNGLQKITTDQASLTKNVKVQGSTLVNRFGKTGNCDSITTGWDNSGQSATVALDTANALYGDNAYKVTVKTGAGGTGFIPNYNYLSYEAGKYYIVLADVKIGTCTTIYIGQLNFGSLYSKSVTSANYSVAYFTYTRSTTGTDYLGLWVTGADGVYGYADGFRHYEITQQMYNDIQNGVYTDDQIAAMFPYVDSVQHVMNPIVKGYGKNLLPPFSEWMLDSHATIVSDYELSINDALNDTSYYELNCIPNQAYTLSLSYELNGGQVYFRDANGVEFNTLPINLTNYTTPSNAVKIGVRLYDNSGSPKTVKNPQLELGSVATSFTPQDVQYLYSVADDQGNPLQLASSVDGSVVDELYQENANSYRVTKRFEKDVQLDGSLSWIFGNGYTGYKRVEVDVSPSTAYPNPVYSSKYDGSILDNIDTSGASDRATVDTLGHLYVSISSGNSGWGDSYTPSVQEIQAYFYGWTMNDGAFGTNYDGTGTKTWIPWGDTDNTNAVTATPTAPSSAITGGKYDYYRLTYQLAQSEDIAVQVEGSVEMIDGDNQVELSQGVIVREVATPVSYSDGQTHISNINVPGCNLSHKTKEIIAVYKSGIVDTEWNFDDGGGAAYGDYQAYIPTTQYDDTASYTVTYIPLDQYELSASALAASFDYSTNLKTVVEQNSQAVSDNSRAITELDNGKANRQQGQWLEPTLINGWTNYGNGFDNAGYFKDEFGIVHLRGAIVGSAGGNIAFILPEGWRPKNEKAFASISNDGTSDTLTRLEITAAGEVKDYTGGIAFFSLENISFRVDE